MPNILLDTYVPDDVESYLYTEGNLHDVTIGFKGKLEGQPEITFHTKETSTDTNATITIKTPGETPEHIPVEVIGTITNSEQRRFKNLFNPVADGVEVEEGVVIQRLPILVHEPVSGDTFMMPPIQDPPLFN